MTGFLYDFKILLLRHFKMREKTTIQEITKKHLKVKTGLHFSMKALALISEKENSFTRMLYFKQPGKPMIELEFVFSGMDCEVPTEGKNTYQISFQFDESYLQSFSSENNPFAEINFRLFAADQQIPVCCNTQMLLHEIVNSKHEGVMEKIFLESKALSLLLCTHQCYAQAQVPDCSACKFLTKPYEKEKILQAREILLENLDKTITIPQLSREVGINQCYLKKGFKELFNTTIFDFVQEQRMLKAKMLLTTSDTSVTEIAYALGYSNTSNFSTAFKKQTGILPSEYQRN